MNENEDTTTQNLWNTIKAVLRESSGEGNGTPLQYSCMENPGRLQSMGSLRVGHD